MKKTQRAIEIHSDKEDARNFVNLLTGMQSALANPHVLSSVHPKTKEALQIALDNAASCARNAHRQAR